MYMRNTFVALTTLILAVVSGQSNSASIDELLDIKVGSQAELWLQRSNVEKAAFLDGLCTGFSADPKSSLGAWQCKTGGLNSRSKHRFCGRMWYPQDGMKRVISYFDTFYRDHEHSDLSHWAVVAAFNDEVCGENTISSNLKKYQNQMKCIRELNNMQSGVSPDARTKQSEYCETLKWR